MSFLFSPGASAPAAPPPPPTIAAGASGAAAARQAAAWSGGAKGFGNTVKTSQMGAPKPNTATPALSGKPAAAPALFGT